MAKTQIRKCYLRAGGNSTVFIQKMSKYEKRSVFFCTRFHALHMCARLGYILISTSCAPRVNINRDAKLPVSVKSAHSRKLHTQCTFRQRQTTTSIGLFCKRSLEKRLYSAKQTYNFQTMGWLRLVGSLKLYACFAEYSLFSRLLLQKSPIDVRSLLIDATLYPHNSRCAAHVLSQVRFFFSKALLRDGRLQSVCKCVCKCVNVYVNV